MVSEVQLGSSGAGRRGSRLTNSSADAAKEGFSNLLLQYESCSLRVKAQQGIHCCTLSTLCMQTAAERRFKVLR